MVKYEIARWLNPALTPHRLVFTTYGGSAHGRMTIEVRGDEEDIWSEVEVMGRANGIPEARVQKVSNEHINEMTGEMVR